MSNQGAKATALAKRARVQAPIFAALGDVRRLEIVARLCGSSPQSISQLARESRITRQGMTKHLLVLQSAGIVGSQRDGRRKLFRLEPQVLDEARDYLEAVSQQWDEALQRLKSFVEG